MKDRVFTALLSAALLLAVALRFFFLEADPPYGIVSTSGDFVTDEGWYAKGAILKVKFGHWINPQDHNFQIAAPLHNLLLMLVFKTVGVNLIAARLVALAAFVFTLILFYNILRMDFSRWMALIGCLLVAVGIDNFAFSRLALTEPIAAFLTLSALSLWIFYPGNVWCCLASLALASLAFFEKLLFLHVLLIVLLLWVGDIRQLVLNRHGKKALSMVGAIFLIFAVTLMCFLELRQVSPTDWTSMAARTQEAFFSWKHPKGILNLFKAFAGLMTRRDCTVPLLIILGGMVFFLFKRHQIATPVSRAFKAMFLWGVLGFLALGINYYQPERYFYFFVFPAVYFSLDVIQRFAPERYSKPLFVGLLVLVFLVLQTAWQVPAYVRWALLPKQNSYVSQAEDIAKTITAGHSNEVVLMGDISAFVAFFPGQVRPISMAFADASTICQFVQRWQPAYFINDKPLDGIVKCFPTPVNIAPIKSYTIMNHYYGNDYTLYHVGSPTMPE